jgi:hypothetical protein
MPTFNRKRHHGQQHGPLQDRVGRSGFLVRRTADRRRLFQPIGRSRPLDRAQFPRLSGKPSGRARIDLADYDGTISRSFGAGEMLRTIVLDPMLRAVADIPWDHADGHAQTVRSVLESLPAVDDSAGVPLTAPVLIVPRVFDFALCDVLVQFYDKIGGQDSGFLLDVEGKTARVVDYRLKRRNDLAVAHPQLREAIRSQIVRRLVPAIERFFQFQATRMDRYIVACYDSAVEGAFTGTATTSTSVRSTGVSPSRSISTRITTAAISSFRSLAAAPIARLMAAPSCFHAARCIR